MPRAPIHDARLLLACAVLAAPIVACGPRPPPSAPKPSTETETTATSAKSATNARVPELGPFVGEWSAHGAGLTVRPDGSASLVWRTYRWCSDDPRPPCDGMNGDEIVSGGRASLRLDVVSGHEAHGTVDDSSDPSRLPAGSPITLRLLPDDQLEVQPAAFTFCGPSAPPGACGA